MKNTHRARSVMPAGIVQQVLNKLGDLQTSVAVTGVDVKNIIVVQAEIKKKIEAHDVDIRSLRDSRSMAVGGVKILSSAAAIGGGVVALLQWVFSGGLASGLKALLGYFGV